MSKSERLLELLVTFRGHGRFTVQGLADQYGVSRRTMLRDLQSLSLLGVPLTSTPGRGGGYTLAFPHREISLLLTADEAIGLVLSYDAFQTYSQSPFSSGNISAISKLRAAMAPDVLREVDELRTRVAMVTIPRIYEAPLLPELLRAARDGAHLRIAYESRRGSSERLIYVYGLYAGLGFWYCACFDYSRRVHASLRADRIVWLEQVEGQERPPAMTLQAWLGQRRGADRTLRLRAKVTPRGMKMIDWSGFGSALIQTAAGGGEIDTYIPVSGLEHYARLLLPPAGEVEVESPPELVDLLCKAARSILARYQGTGAYPGVR
jgi:predicted DNA-binding transcriptional regulator YafY